VSKASLFAGHLFVPNDRRDERDIKLTIFLVSSSFATGRGGLFSSLFVDRILRKRYGFLF
jgi:hypothetical protein